MRTKKAQKFNDGNWIFFYWNALCILRVFKRGHSFLLLLLISCCCLLSTFFRVALSLFTFILRFLQLFWLFAFISFFGNYVYQLMEWGNADYLNAKNSKKGPTFFKTYKKKCKKIYISKCTFWCFLRLLVFNFQLGFDFLNHWLRSLYTANQHTQAHAHTHAHTCREDLVAVPWTFFFLKTSLNLFYLRIFGEQSLSISLLAEREMAKWWTLQPSKTVAVAILPPSTEAVTAAEATTSTSASAQNIGNIGLWGLVYAKERGAKNDGQEWRYSM